MSIETVTAATEIFARKRNALIATGQLLNDEIDACLKKHSAKIAEQSTALISAQSALEQALKDNPALFPEGAKSMVIEGIKVGYQKGKESIEMPDPAKSELLYAHELNVAERSEDKEKATRLRAAGHTSFSFVDLGLKKLLPDELKAIGAKRLAGADSVLVMPADKEGMKRVQDSIKMAIRQVETA